VCGEDVLQWRPPDGTHGLGDGGIPIDRTKRRLRLVLHGELDELGHVIAEQALCEMDAAVDAGGDARRSLDPTGRGRQRWMNRWKPALNAFAITFEGRIFPTT
jgi:hypothetical protein